MNILKRAFMYGVIGRTKYSSLNKSAIAGYKMLKNLDPDVLSKELMATKSLIENNMARMGAVLLLSETEYGWTVFNSEICGIHQLLNFFSLFDILNIRMKTIHKDMINWWLAEYLTENMVMECKDDLKIIMKDFKPKRYDYKSVVLNGYVAEEKDFLPKSNAIKILRNNFLAGVYKPEHKNIINRYHIGLNDIRKYLYELLEQEKEEIVCEALPYTNSAHLKYLKEIYPGTIPEKVQSGCFEILKNGTYYDSVKIQNILPYKYPFISEKTQLKLKVFVDNSYSMQSSVQDIEDFLYYFGNTTEGSELYLVSSSIRKIDKYTKGDKSERGSAATTILNNICEGETILFITDGYDDIHSMLKTIRSKYKNFKIVIWFINKTQDYSSKFKNIYYFYGGSEELYAAITDFVCKL